MHMKNIDSILAVGSIAIDTLETPNGNHKNILGGSATYFSVAASLLAPIKLVGVVGNDFPSSGWEMFKSRQINIDNVQILNGKTFRWGGRYNHDYSTRDTLFTDLGVFDSFSPTINSQDRISSPLVFLGNIQPDLQLSIANMIKSYDFVVADTMNLWIDLAREKLTEVFSIANIFLINHEEAFQYTGLDNVQDSAKKLHEAGPEVIIIKLGSKGSFLSFENNGYFIPAFPVKKVLDPTGAGDSFAGGFMACLAQPTKTDFLESAIMGTAMASFCVECVGTQALQKITTKDLNKRMNIIKNKMNTAVLISS